ncbi:MAG: hypothetical protein ACYDEE_00560 [Ignavibacteriaceae bacterium]
MKMNIIFIALLFPFYFSFGQNESDKDTQIKNMQQNKIVKFESTSDSSSMPLKVVITNLPQKTFWENISPFMLILLGALLGWFPTYFSQKKNIKYQHTLKVKKDWVEKFKTVIIDLSNVMLNSGDMFRNSETRNGLRHARAGNQNQTEKIFTCFSELGYLLDLNKSMHKELSSLLTDTHKSLFNNVSKNTDEKIMDNIGQIIKLAHKIVEEEEKKI